VPDNAVQFLARLSGWLLAGYIVVKIIDTLVWANTALPADGLSFGDIYGMGPYGALMVIGEIGIFGVVPAVLLLIPQVRRNPAGLIVACLLNCTGIVLNRFIFILGGLAIPVFPFERVWSYLPTWQEWGIALALLGYGFLLFSVSYRYLPVFPKEQELNPAMYA
jgi:molybdopterin-containing oxidoreductase family membrane subunit